MGDPRRLRKAFSKPPHPWQKVRIDDEKIVFEEYGLKNKKELWKTTSLLRLYAENAKRIIRTRNAQSEIEEKQLISKLQKIGILPASATIADVLGISSKDIFGRRLQTVVFKKGLARTIKQARQFIVHEHIMVGDKIISRPSYLVPVDLEEGISFAINSSLSSAEHPERISAAAPKAPEEPKNKKREARKKERRK